MSSWAVPGAKCVCVDANWPEDLLDRGGVTRTPMINEVLTVASVRDEGYLIFVEVPEYQTANRSVAWDVQCFRPLTSTSQERDVAMIKSLLVADKVSA